MVDYILIPYVDDDYEFVYLTKKNAYQRYVEANWGEWNEDQQRGFFVDFMDNFAKDIQIIIVDNKKVGFVQGTITEADDYDLGNICIIPEFQGKGLGTKILHRIIEENKDRDIYLQYFKQNPVGILYSRLGFEKCEEKPYHIKMVLRKRG
ncbi:MAG: GNAT family N-acetyltransferase [Clostridiales bacterium]|nr:GNAT family N-acetyltransferase [Clostridiales bacterium]